jgi:putative transposase
LRWRGFVYLAAVVDWFSRRVLSHRVSITMEAGFCVEALEEALAIYGKPEIFNTDQGSQFTSIAFTEVLIGNAIAISMDGKCAWRGNVFVERIWKSVKYEEVYLKAYDSVSEARASIGRYLERDEIRLSRFWIPKLSRVWFKFLAGREAIWDGEALFDGFAGTRCRGG